MKVLDKEGLEKADDRKRKKKLQFDVKYQVENYYKVRIIININSLQQNNIEKMLKKEQYDNNRKFYDHYKELDQRGNNT